MNGLYLIKPTSVSATGTSPSTTVTANGSVSFTTCETLSLNGVFSADFDNYIIVARHSTTADYGWRFRYRTSGTDNSTASSYTNQYWFADSTSVTATRSALNYGWMSWRGNSMRAGVIHYVYGPFLTQPTAWRSIVADDYLNASVLDTVGTHNQSTSYDGITLIAAASTFTGRVAVYGMVK